MVNIDLSERIWFATPTSVDMIGVLLKAHSKIDWGPPSTLEATI